jgi:hypothetical protein
LRLFLDAHVSGKRVGEALREAGHDVKAADQPEFEGWDDPDIFKAAAAENRILVTANVRHFVPLAECWINSDRTHAGLILLPNTLRHEQFGLIISRVSTQLSGTTQEDWENRTAWA